MKDLKGKCKTCLGCGLLEDKGFKGRKKCKYYARANIEEFWAIIIVAIIVIAMIIGFGFYAYCRINMLCGG